MPPLAMLAILSLNAGPNVEIVAHRGASWDAPENTVAALKLAWEQRADASEFDVYLSRDGEVVVIHDKDTKRTAGVERLVAEQTLEELRKLDAGRWKGEKFAGERVPTLAEMLAAVPAGKRVFVEVKCGVEVVPALAKRLKASKLKPDQTPVISFDADVIAAVKKALPDVPAYWLVSLKPKNGKVPTAKSLVERARKLGADGLDLSATEALDSAYAKQIKDAGLKLYVYTVNDADVARRMVEIGVDGITTDRPAWLRDQLSK
ncbi:MAG: glycerophosphodiester phosphodiesterase [Gemmataceae bacterium]